MRNTIHVILATALVGCLAHAASVGLGEETTTAWTPNPLCPYPSEETIFYPDPDDCSKYYECFEGKLYIMNCPDNLYWNEAASACDYLENTSCNNSYTPPVPTETSNTSPATVATSTPPSGTEEEPTTAWTPNPLCPYPSEETIFYPDPDDCSKYYECFEGKLYVMNCPDNLYWNEAASACDYLENTNCNSMPTTPTSETANVATSTLPAGHLCANQPDGSYIANPADCHDFYECVAGKEVDGICPAGTAWNEQILNCDFPENVAC